MKKNDLGQFYTPQPVAKFMVEWVLEKNKSNILDPAVGLGIYLFESKKICSNLEMTAFEIDDETVSKLKEICTFDFKLFKTDYLTHFSDKTYSAIVCNPPYKKFQQISNRNDYIKFFFEKYGIKLSGFSNLYVYFLIKSLNELSPGGRCCFIVPFEFLNAGYGKAVKQCLLDLKVLKHIIKFDSSQGLFDDATTTSCILCLEKTKNEKIDFVCVKNSSELKFPFEKEMIKTFFVGEVKAEEKWSNYFKKEAKNNFKNLTKLSSFASVKRGIATGNNLFFTLNKEKIKELNLSKDVCSLCVVKSSQLKKCVITTSDVQKLVDENKTIFVFDGTKACTKADFDYIAYGEKIGVNKTYLVSHRNPWFSLEKKEIAPLLISAFCKGKPKIVKNEAKIKNLATFHGIYFHKNLDEDFVTLMFCFLLTPTAQQLLSQNKREYAKGLNKFEPSDLNNALVLDVSKISLADKQKIKKIYNFLRENNSKNLIEELEQIFLKYLIN